MPYQIRKTRRGCQVIGSRGKRYSRRLISCKKAGRQARLLRAIEHGWKPSPQRGGAVGDQITNTTPQAVMLLKGHTGHPNSVLAIQICQDIVGGKISPELYQDLYNLRAVRGKTNGYSSLMFDTTMSGPHHYFGTVDPTKWYTIGGEEGKLTYREAIGTTASPLKPLPPTYITRLTNGPHVENYRWKHGTTMTQQNIKRYQIQTEDYDPISPDGSRISANSLFADPGIMEIQSPLKFKTIPDPWNYDLSDFKAQIVRNDTPFRFNPEMSVGVQAATLPLRVITYNYAERYVPDYIMQGNGIFIERHDFIQAITPMDSKCGGFIMLGKEESEAGTLSMIAAEVPYGYTLLVDVGSIHGDSTMTGMYMMSMTGSLEAMATADTVFIKDRDRNRAAAVRSDPPLDPVQGREGSSFWLSSDEITNAEIQTQIGNLPILQPPMATVPPAAYTAIPL